MTLAERNTLWIDGGLVLAWAGLVWMLGGGDFSAAETSRIIGALLDWLFPDWSRGDRIAWQGIIRKLAHPVEYGVFAVLVLRFIDARQRRRFGRAPLWLSCATALALAGLLAMLDESRQATLTSRTGSLADVALDVFGAAVALVLAITAATLGGGRRWGIPGWPSDRAPSALPEPPPSDPPTA